MTDDPLFYVIVAAMLAVLAILAYLFLMGPIRRLTLRPV